jgi:ribonucleoside-diphosphate reductase beta chain
MSNEFIQAKKLFNPFADQSLDKRRLIGGETTNMMILSQNKYDWSFKMYRHMMGNFWIPETVSLGQDKLEYETKLTDQERDTYDKIISFLVFLDSLQTANLPNISEFVTLPEINLLITIQGYQEAIHSQSYGYVLQSVTGSDRQSDIYNIAVKDPLLVRRNKLIADYYEEFIVTQSKRGFAKVCMANYILEGLYFYAGFAFFYNLSRNEKMTGTATEIKYINRDELSHLALFQNLFVELRKEEPEIFTKSFDEELRTMMKTAVEHEIEWSNYAIGDKIQGLSSSLLSSYIKYISNVRLRKLGLDVLYPEVTVDPLPFIDQFTKFNETKTDFFEEQVINYTKGNLKLDSIRKINIDDIE